jgi:hypothetical protein
VAQEWAQICAASLPAHLAVASSGLRRLMPTLSGGCAGGLLVPAAVGDLVRSARTKFAQDVLDVHFNRSLDVELSLDGLEIFGLAALTRAALLGSRRRLPRQS